MSEGKGILYRMKDCGHCEQTVALLKALDIPEDEFEVRIAHTDDREGKRIWGEINRIVGRLTVPVLVFSDGSFLAYPAPGDDAEENPQEDENRRWREFSRDLATEACNRPFSSVRCS